MWRPGQSGNPTGKGGIYHEMQRRARECSPEVIDFLTEIARDTDEDARNRIVAISMLLDRGWGRTPLCDPVQHLDEPKVIYDMSQWSPEERQQIALLNRAAV
jgi:hypothetical protein